MYGEGKPLLLNGGAAGNAATPGGCASPKLYGSQASPHLKGRLIGQQLRRAAAGNGESFLSDDSSVCGGDGGGDADDDHHKTDAFETYIHLVKGYLGAGCLSLPWAVSQLGLLNGVSAIAALSVWSSYNCWVVVSIKRHIDFTTTPSTTVPPAATPATPATATAIAPTTTTDAAAAPTATNNTNVPAFDGSMSETSSIKSGTLGGGGGASSVVSSRTSITYAEVGDWAYGTQFQHYVRVCVCTQQLAICTVFVSFVGENLLALLHYCGIDSSTSVVATHAGVMTVALPFLMGLSFLPTIKSLGPALILGTGLLLTAFAAIGFAVGSEWRFRPSEGPTLNPPLVPLALCAILYSYEGINLILPVEATMRHPEQFAKVFVGAMATVATVLASFSAVCVAAFGLVTSGSVTAFLLAAYRDDPVVTMWVMVANTAVSLSVLLTYPLQLFPALELIAPMTLSSSPRKKFRCCGRGGTDEDEDEDDDSDDVGDDDDLAAFEPLPPLPEHGRYEAEDDDLPDMEHHYYCDDEEEERARNGLGVGSGEEDKKEDDDNNVGNESDDDEDDEDDQKSAISSMMGTEAAIQGQRSTSAIPGDSVQLRAALVILTYAVAVAVPNVQSLISLAGALAGSSTALLIPPVLELAWIKQIEQQDPPVASAASAGEQPHHGIVVLLRKLFRTKSQRRLFLERAKCYVLLLLGLIFMCIGTFASVSDIIRIYRSGDADDGEGEQGRR